MPVPYDHEPTAYRNPIVNGALYQSGWNVRFSNRVSLSSSVFPVFVVTTAWVMLLYVVGLAIMLAATSVSRIGQ